MAADLVLGGDLCPLGAEGLRVDCGSELYGWVTGCGQTKLEQGGLRHEFDAIGKFVMKIGQGDAGAAVPELLIDTSIVSARGLRPDRRDVILLDQRGAIGQCSENVVKRDALVVDARLFDAFAEAEVELGPIEPMSVGGTEKIVGDGSARSSREAEEAIVFQSAAQYVIEAVADVPLQLNGIAVVAPRDGGE